MKLSRPTLKMTLLLLVGCYSIFLPASDMKHVAVTQIVEHPALDAVRKGVKDVLSELGWQQGKNIKWDYQSAQGSTTTAVQIAKKFAGDQADVIVAISTASAQAVVSSARNSNIVFSAVTDPIGAKLVTSWDHHSANVTGVSDLTPINKHLKLIKEIVPTVQTIGVIYNPGETNSVTLVKLIHQYSGPLNLKIIEAVSPKSADVQTAARSLLGKVDAIYLPTDNTVISALEGVIKIAEAAKIPVFSGDTDSVKRGTVAALGFNYYDIGRKTGLIVNAILRGKSPKDIPVQDITNTELYVNPRAAERMGIHLKPALIARAKEVVQ